VHADEVVGGALHAARGRKEIGDAGIARMLALERHAQPQQTGAQAERHVQGEPARAGSFVARPERYQACLVPAGFFCDAVQGGGLDRREPGR
jgi:hypothetical protein